MLGSGHPRFGGYLPRFPALHSPTVLSIKVEDAPGPLLPCTTVDIVVEENHRLIPLLFVEFRDGQLLFPTTHPQSFAALHQLQPVINRLDAAFRQTRQPSIEVFTTESRFNGWAQRASDPSAFVPGISLYAHFLDHVERYRVAAARSFGRTVIDLNPWTGYGAHFLHGAKHYATLPIRDEQRELVSRFDFAKHCNENDRADVVLAFALDLAEIERVLECAHRALASGGTILLSAMGEGGRDALQSAGLQPTPFMRPGGEGLGPLPDFLAIIEPKRTYPVAQPELPASISVAPRPLSILFGLRPSAEEAFGGDVVQVRMTARALEARGHRVVVDTSPSLDATGFDVIHLSNLTSHVETLKQTQSVRAFSGPIVMMPIFIDHCDEAVWGMSVAPTPFLFSTTSENFEEKLHLVAARLAVLDYTDRRLMPPPARTEMTPGYTATQKEILSGVDYLIANAYSEVFAIFRWLTVDVPFSIAPSCCDPAVYFPERASEFTEKYGLRDFVLSTGRIEVRKNQIFLAEVMKRWPDRTLVLIGSNKEPAYSLLLKHYAPSNVVYIGNIPEAELAGAYAAARVVAMPSWDEVVSLSAVNAAACGASLVLTRNAYELEYMGDDAIYTIPGDTEDLARALDEAWNTYERSAERRRLLSERVRSSYTWDRAAELIETTYYRVLADNPRGARRTAMRP